MDVRGSRRPRRAAVVLVAMSLSACEVQSVNLGLTSIERDGGLNLIEYAGQVGGRTSNGERGTDARQDPGRTSDGGVEALDAIDWADVSSDPSGYPAHEQHTPPWCATGDLVEERCGNDLDDDCDGTVDEFAELGAPCATRCGAPGSFACSQSELICLDQRGACLPGPLCGNGKLDLGEACDSTAGDLGWSQVSMLEPYCREDCRLDTRFAGACWTLTDEGKRTDIVFFRGGVAYNICDSAGLVCSDHVKSCVPKIGNQGLFRCPRLPRPATDDELSAGYGMEDVPRPSYTMIESDSGECWVSCNNDADCPPTVGTCYMGTCVVW